MPKKSMSHCGKKKKNGHSKAKNRRTLATNVSPSPIKSSLPALPMETHSLELSSVGPSTSECTSQNTIAPLRPDELIEINKKVKSLVDNCFQDRSEITVNRRIIEEIASKTLEDFYSDGDKFKNVTEAKHLIEKCNAFKTNAIKLNRQAYALEKRVEDAKLVIRNMIHKKKLLNDGTMKTNPKRQVRSVGLQVCIEGPMFISKPVITCITSITSQQMGRILPPEEHCHTTRKCTVNKEVDIKKVSILSNSKVIQSHSLNSGGEKNPSEIKSKFTSKRMSEECASSRTLHIKQNPSESKSNIITRSMSKKSGNNITPPKKENLSESKSNITSRRMSTRKRNLKEAEQQNSSVNVKFIKELNEVQNVKKGRNLTKEDNEVQNVKKGRNPTKGDNEVKNVKKGRNLTKEDNEVQNVKKGRNLTKEDIKGIKNGIPIVIKQEKIENVFIKEEIISDVIEISDNKSTVETITDESSVKVKSIKKLNEIKNVKQVSNLNNVDNKGFKNGIPIVIKQEKSENVIIKKEVFGDEANEIIKISDDESTVESITDESSVKDRSIKQLKGIKNVKQVSNLTNKGFKNGNPIIKQKKSENVIIKEEVFDYAICDIIDISDDEIIEISDEELEVTITKKEDAIKVRKEVGVQVNVDIY
nr:uncharacterized protein PF11_0213-like [Halyomorpha halys]